MKFIFYTLTLVLICSCNNEKEPRAITYDIVIENARVIDPETQTDQVLNVANRL
jgi:hypothetical protein